MGLVGWIVLGLAAGCIASMLVNKRGGGFACDVLLGIVGAVIGGWMFNWAGARGTAGFHPWSLLVAVAGAVLFLVIWHVIRRPASRA